MGTDDFFRGFAFRAHEAGGVPPEVANVLDEAAAIRGWCIQSFTQVEFMLAYLVHKAKEHWPEYAEAKWSYSPGERPKRVRELLKMSGPLREHASEIEQILVDMEGFEDFRHMMAHGWGDVIQARNGLFLRWRRYTPQPCKPLAIKLTSTKIETFREQGEQFVRFSERAVDYFRRLFLHYRLEEGGPDAAIV